MLNLTLKTGCKDLRQEDCLTISHQNLHQLPNLSQQINLRYLNASKNKLENLEALQKLTNLEYLYLFQNSIKDHKPLCHLTNLKDLYLHYNQRFRGLNNCAPPIALSQQTRFC